MRTALVPIDTSGPALRALQYAMSVHEGIQIINVQPKADALVLLMHRTQEEVDRMLIESGRSRLDEARKLLVDAGRPYREHVLIGDPAPTIVDVARAEGVDVIVMGTRGMGAWQILPSDRPRPRSSISPRCR